MTRDPIGFEGGINQYSYVRNNPIRYYDPTGLYGKDVHYDFTKLMALRAGCCEDGAEAIANADQNVDVDRNAWNGGVTKEGIKNRADWHFPSTERINYLRSIAYNTFSAIAAGDYLHVLQDSFSHEGFDPELGHGYPTFNDPDNVNNDIDKANLMLMVSYRFLQDFCQKNRYGR